MCPSEIVSSPPLDIRSQLKWKHFLDRPRPLSHLQAFDSASCGPLGSLYLMGNLRLGAFLAFFFALITYESKSVRGCQWLVEVFQRFVMTKTY